MLVTGCKEDQGSNQNLGGLSIQGSDGHDNINGGDGHDNINGGAPALE